MLSTIVTTVLAVIALALAMRNARLQQEQRRRGQDAPDEHS